MGKCVNIYKTESSWNDKKPTFTRNVSNTIDGVTFMESEIASGAYMCTLEDLEAGFIEKRFTRQGGKYTYLDAFCVNLLNEITKNVIVSNNFKGTATCLLEDSPDGRYQLRYQRNKTTPVRMTDCAASDLQSLFQTLRSKYGITKVEGILFSPRRAGRYKSACVSPSKTEPGSIRITLDIH